MSDIVTVSITNDPHQAFKDKLASKIKDDIGDLMPDDVLQAMVARAIEEMLFKPRIKTTRDGFHNRQEETPSWFMEIMAEAAKPLLQSMAAEYVDKHKPQIQAQIAAALEPHSVVIMAVTALAKTMTDALRAEASMTNMMLQNVMQNINNRR